jgi:hypothetical protein
MRHKLSSAEENWSSSVSVEAKEVARRKDKLARGVRTILRPNQPPVQCVLGASSPRINIKKHKTHNSLRSRVDVKKIIELSLHILLLVMA